MADPVSRESIMDMLKRDHLHSQDISSTLEFLRKNLDREGIPFGLIGGLALTYHGYERFTDDIDIVTSPEGLNRIHEVIVGKGLLPRETGKRKKLRQTQFKVNIDVVTSGEHAGSNESPTIFPLPDSEAFTERDGLQVVTLEKLIELKISSGVWGHRGQDLVDVQKVIQANGLSESFAEKLPLPLRAKYLELLEDSRLEREIEE